MNILLFVTSLLMILSILTYTRVDNFRYFLGIQSEFERYMRTMERVYTNQKAENWYKSVKAKNGKAGTPSATANPSTKPNDKPPAETPVEKPPADEAAGETATPAEAGQKPSKEPGGIATSRLSFRILIDPKLRAKNDAAYHQTFELAKQLMKKLYGDQPFFKNMLEERPSFLDDLLHAIEQAVLALPEGKRPTTTEDLANLFVGDELEHVYYLMLKGCPKEDLLANDTSIKSNRPSIIKPQIDEDAEAEDENDAAEEAIEYLSPQGYESLLNYITLRNTTKIRLYLASRELLMAIYGQPNVVESIITTRQNLYHEVMHGKMDPKEAQKQFQASFEGHNAGESQSMFDFRVSKTNPAEYN